MLSPLAAALSSLAKRYIRSKIQSVSTRPPVPPPVVSLPLVSLPRAASEEISAATLSALDWREFELFVGQVYQRAGYQVEQRGGRNPDGGVDLVLCCAQGRLLVQCKHWKAYQVGVRQVRELYGVLTAEGAAGALLVTGGRFTREAQAFAAGKPLMLVDGPAFIAQANQAQGGQGISLVDEVREASKAFAPECPVCCRPMLRRTARSGANAGSQFWGCPAFPRCRGTRQV